MKRWFYTLTLLGVLFAPGCSVLTEVFEQLPPSISELEATRVGSDLPADVLFSWKVSDPDTNTLACKLTFQDNSSRRVENCSQITDFFHAYSEPGTYVVQLSVSDGANVRSSTVPVVIHADEAAAEEAKTPDIRNFTAVSQLGPAPLVTFFSWELAPDAPPTVCVIDFGDGNSETVEACHENTEVAHEFLEPGDYRVVLTAQREDGAASKGIAVVVKSVD